MTTPLVLTYSHNVIEHLGLKLYQNQPTRVIAELVSNAWDANAAKAWIELNMTPSPQESTASMTIALPLKMAEVTPAPSPRWVAVHDCGHGMTHQEVAERFLVIGAPKRALPEDKSRGNQRPLMGRKGIGKLAPFGIAGEVDLVTCAIEAGTPTVVWLQLSLAAIKGQAHVGDTAKYSPKIVLDGGSLADLVEHADDTTDQVKLFAERVQANGGTGTLVLLRSLSIHRAITPEALNEALGRRFTATLRQGFEVFVSESKVEATTAIPTFEFRIPQVGYSTEDVDGREVRYWVGFVKSATWSADEAGVGVYAHGKICQDRPFTFGSKGKEIFTRYMFAVVEADWLDELAEDLISTDRTNVNWDSDAVKALHAWGKSKVTQWVGSWEAFRAGPEKRRNRERVKKGIEDKLVPAITEQEQEQVAALLSEITPSMPRDDEGEAAKDRLAAAVATAWLQEPMRELIHQVWSQLGTGEAAAPVVFAGLVEKLVEYSVPESLNLAVVFAQRAFALTKLYDFVHNGRELDLQKLLEDFPWIIEPDSVYLTANQPLSAVVDKAVAAGHLPTGRRRNVGGVPEANKPDFVFLSSPEETRIVVVELKNPQNDLTLENRQQLSDYLAFLEGHYPDATLRGYLVGRLPPGGMQVKHVDMEVVPWTEVMQRSRARYVSFLAAMLSSVPAAQDKRVDQVRDFAGPEVWDLLKKIAEKNNRLASVMQAYATT